jgi:hypothetical protein
MRNKYDKNHEQCTMRRAGLHKKQLNDAQISIISHTADAHGGFSSQFRRVSCSPLEVF